LLGRLESFVDWAAYVVGRMGAITKIFDNYLKTRVCRSERILEGSCNKFSYVRSLDSEGTDWLVVYASSNFFILIY